MPFRESRPRKIRGPGIVSLRKRLAACERHRVRFVYPFCSPAFHLRVPVLTNVEHPNSEHIWRFHSPKYRCEYCGYRWTAVKNRTVVQGLRDAHIPGCREQNGGTLRPCEPTDLELLSEAQQSDFEKVLKIRDIGKKFAALYRACGKPEPETYRASFVPFSFFNVTPKQAYPRFPSF